MSARALSGFAMLGVVASLFAGCGDGDGVTNEICNAAEVACLNEESGEVCSSDGTSRLPFNCDEGEICGRPPEGGGYACIGACRPGEKECASEAISRVCSADGKAWLPLACAPGTGCDGNEEVEGDPNPDYGTCVRTDDPTVTVCEPEEQTCADGRTVKACEEDGSNWVYAPCAANEACEAGECVVDPDKRCTPNTGTCIDARHVRKCADDGERYEEPEECPGETTCSDGACRGSVCTVEEVRCDDVRDGNLFDALADGSYQARARYHCVDGESWEVTECAQFEVCAYTDISSTAVNQYVEELKSAVERGSSANLPVFDVPESSRATCQTPACAAPFAFRELLNQSGAYAGLFFGSYACGDATLDDPTSVNSFSLCEGLPPYNNLHWANYACPEHTECSYVENVSQPNGSSQAPVCRSECADGDVRCFDAQGESTIECVDGEWDPTTIEACALDGRERWCRRNVATGTNFTQATCQDPACVLWQDEFETFVVPPGYGACGDDGMFYECLPDGSMGEGVDCPGCVRSVVRAPGVTPPSQTPGFFAGYQPGYCVDECEDDEQMCLDIGSSEPSPFYYECAGGRWTNIASCPNGRACRDYRANAESPRAIVCGVCFEGEMRCVDEDGALGGRWRSLCNEQNEWGEPEPCPRGVCTEDDQQSAGPAACEDECIPETKSCSGTTAEVTCTDAASYGEPEPCGTGTACISSVPALARLGCVECTPPSASSIPDSRCVGNTLQICGPSGTWDTLSMTTCPNGCVGSQAPNTAPGARASCRANGGAGAGGQSGAGGGGAAGSGGQSGTAGTSGASGGAAGTLG